MPEANECMLKQKILWAIDPFDPPKTTPRNAVKLLALLSKSLNLNVDPLYIFRPLVNASSEIAVPMLHDLEKAAEEALTHTLELLEKENHPCPPLPILPPHILATRRPTLAGAVRELLDYAKSEGCSLIVCNTHGRSGVKRLFLGSFVEALLTQASAPVLVLSPEARNIPHQLSHLLFPTDFSSGSYRAFKDAVFLARSLGSEITLFHSIPFPLQPYSRGNLFYLGQYRTLMRGFIHEQKLRAEGHAEKWLNWGTAQSVEIHFKLSSTEDSPGTQIIHEAKKQKTSMIVMETHSTRSWSSTLFGSTTRHVVRGAPCPVWVIGKKARGVTTLLCEQKKAAVSALETKTVNRRSR